MHVSGTLVLLVGLIGAFGSGCAVRVVGRTHVHTHDVVFHDAPDLVYVEPGVYVVRDYGVAVYYTDGYYWRHSGGVWYRTSHWNDPWVTVHMHGVPHLVSHRNHNHYVHFRGSAGAHVFRQPARPGHHGASPGSGHASAGGHASGGGSTGASASGIHDGPSPTSGSDRGHASVKAQGQVSPQVEVDRRGGNDNGRGNVSKDSSPSKDAPRGNNEPTERASVKSDSNGKGRQPSESRAEPTAPRQHSSGAASAPAKKAPSKSRAPKKKSRR